MKKKFVGSFTAAVLTVSAPSMAHSPGGNNSWVGPMIGGMVIGAVIQAQRPVYVAPPVVVYQPQPQVIYQQQIHTPQQYCEPRSEVINGVLVQGQYCYTR